IKEARHGEITFVANPRYVSQIKRTKASAIISWKTIQYNDKPMIQVENPYWAWAKVVEAFAKNRQKRGKGVDTKAIVGTDVEIGEDAWIQGYAFIGDNVKIGERVVISPFVYIGDNTEIGNDTYIYPNVTIREETRIGERVIIHSGTVVGSDGFGFAQVSDRYHKVPQIGTVIIEDDVEIGAGVTIDRGLRETIIGRGTKIDNLVQIAHNVEIGEDCVIIAQVGIAGSTKIKDRVILAAQSGVVGHITIGDDAQFAARSGVSKDIPPGPCIYSGSPAMPHTKELRVQASMRRLPALMEKIQTMEKRIGELEKEINNAREGS
ncbi:UDP-3-O-(3-hydroxymyristoyl)glucosamine N-acyltransferase, partial [Candidatus Poribacteria bacterium]|nr:UDP-3-O-(3-hydroxymyristoyl)glucosamine N-acyltransferase [Candidatus Poribacteria bacterium]